MSRSQQHAQKRPAAVGLLNNRDLPLARVTRKEKAPTVHTINGVYFRSGSVKPRRDELKAMSRELQQEFLFLRDIIIRLGPVFSHTLDVYRNALNEGLSSRQAGERALASGTFTDVYERKINLENEVTYAIEEVKASPAWKDRAPLDVEPVRTFWLQNRYSPYRAQSLGKQRRRVQVLEAR
ncbi:glycosyltransferase family 1 protein [Pseudohyphozyma bogoriensis]|nr:glycosyltransferase family 1 protein [Pseudohyphozyma bogoriensis]